jgi:AcrR family transcriptional regulator
MPKGRPRAFDPDKAIAAALPIFMEKGFEGATFGELVAAMGINPPSFYAAFGNKEQLFRRVIDLYAAQGEPIVREALAEPTAGAVIERLLRSTADAHTDPTRPAGCLFVQGALCSGDKSASIRDELQARRTMVGPLLEARLRLAQDQGDRTVAGDPSHVALYVSTVIQGLAVQATSGNDRAALHHVVDVALKGLSNA